MTEKQVRDALAHGAGPELHRDLISLDFVRDIKVTGSDVSFSITLTTPACPLKDQIQAGERAGHPHARPGRGTVEIAFDARVRADKRIQEKINLAIKTIIAVGSGKGGVGKSTVAANIAVALAQFGAAVGLLDADIYGPNIPTLMGVDELPPPEGEKMVPALAHGVKVMSMGFLIGQEEALVWRGPMIHSALRQLLTEVVWGELDYLVVDLPPGHGGRAAQRGPARAAHRRGGGHHPAASLRERRAARGHRIPEAQRAGARDRGEHERGGLRQRRRGARRAGDGCPLPRAHPPGPAVSRLGDEGTPGR